MTKFSTPDREAVIEALPPFSRAVYRVVRNYLETTGNPSRSDLDAADVAFEIGVPPVAINAALRVLRDAGLVRTEKTKLGGADATVIYDTELIA